MASGIISLSIAPPVASEKETAGLPGVYKKFGKVQAPYICVLVFMVMSTESRWGSADKEYGGVDGQGKAANSDQA